MDPDTIWNAIYGQESNYGTNNRTSVTGAVGPGQIQPETFAQYAKSGENINSPADNIAVSKRIVQDYYNRYNGDPSRIATAYFSGPNNVAPITSEMPYLKNKSDPTGKNVASYVNDINSRLNMPNNFDPNNSFSQWEKPTSNTAQLPFDQATAFKNWEKPNADNTVKSNSSSMIPTPSTTPEQIAAWNSAVQKTKDISNNWWAENYHPLLAIPETFQAGRNQLGQGIQDIAQGNVATGTGNIALGAVNTVLAPLLGPYNETFRTIGNAIGNPQAAEIASMVLPSRGILGLAKTALPTTRAARGIINLVGKENIPNVLQKLANPNLSLMDVSEPVKTVAAGLANNPETPTAQNIMRAAYDARTGARQNIVQQSIDNTLGPNIDVKDYLDQLKQNVRDVGEKRIAPALASAQPIGVMPLVDRLDSVIKYPGTSDQTISRLSKLKDQITAEAGNDGFIDPNKLHGIQWRLRAEAENLAKSASGSDRNLSGPLFAARNDMVDAIDNASNGRYKPALAGFRDESHIQDAFDKGFGILKSGGIEDFPEFWNAWKRDAQPAELVAARVGALTAIRRQVEGMQSGARRGENILGTTFNTNKLSTLFGPEQTAKLSSLLEDSRSMADTNSLLYRNSKTAQVTAGQNYFQPRQVGSPSGAATGIGAGLLGTMAMAGGAIEPGLVGMGIGALKGIHTGLQYAGKLSDRATATNFARLASAGAGPDRNALISILQSANTVGQGNKLNNFNSALLKLAAP